jgi:C-terminal processing protease CtpA/Prc
VGTDAQLTTERTAHVVSTIGADFEREYIFPDVGSEVAKTLRDHLGRGRYSDIESPIQLAERLTADIREVTHDVHVRVAYGSPDDVAPPHRATAYSELVRTAAFDRVERLDRNIGYLKVAVFSVPRVFEPRANEAMHLLADTDALILDVRGTPGGHAGSVAYLCSFFFDADKPVHLNSFFNRQGRQTKIWTRPVPERYLNKPVYVLTSRTTGSGAEEFAYDMQAFSRAIIVGETTAGGAHTGTYRSVDVDFRVFVPTGRAENPVTGTNWERTGVRPDIAATADTALTVASNDYLLKAQAP